MTIPLVRRIFSAALATMAATLAMSLCSVGQAQTTPLTKDSGVANPASIIYIGNSFFYFNNGMSAMVSGLLASADAKATLRSSLVTISGSGFDWHDVDSYFRPNAVGRYSFAADNSVNFNKIERLFDLALIMDCSQCPLHPQLKDIFWDYAKRHSDTIRKNGAQPVFFMSWAYLDKPEMTAQLAEAYTLAGNANKALVVPAGLAFAAALKQRPEVALYIADKRHPTVAGSYLAAATTYATIFKKSPVGLKYTAGLDATTAAFLQGVAAETVEGYFKR
jgi:hypothetical protein